MGLVANFLSVVSQHFYEIWKYCIITKCSQLESGKFIWVRLGCLCFCVSVSPFCLPAVTIELYLFNPKPAAGVTDLLAFPVAFQ